MESIRALLRIDIIVLMLRELFMLTRVRDEGGSKQNYLSMNMLLEAEGVI